MKSEIAEYKSSSIGLAAIISASEQMVYAAICTPSGDSVPEAMPKQQAIDALRIGRLRRGDAVAADGGAVIVDRIVNFDPAADFGDDEIVDFSVFDLYSDALTWEPRLANTKGIKLKYSARHRLIARRTLLASIYVRFATGDMSESVLHMVDIGGNLITDADQSTRFDGAALPVGKNGARWLNWMWLATITKQAGGKFAVQIKEVSGGPIRRQTKLYLECDAGYLPRRTITTDASGRAEFVWLPTGLEAGEPYKIKVSANHFSGLASYEGAV